MTPFEADLHMRAFYREYLRRRSGIPERRGVVLPFRRPAQAGPDLSEGDRQKLIIDSINVLDRPVIVAYLMIIVLMFITINLIVDLSYSMLDPRVRLESKGT